MRNIFLIIFTIASTLLSAQDSTHVYLKILGVNTTGPFSTAVFGYCYSINEAGGSKMTMRTLNSRTNAFPKSMIIIDKIYQASPDNILLSTDCFMDNLCGDIDCDYKDQNCLGLPQDKYRCIGNAPFYYKNYEPGKYHTLEYGVCADQYTFTFELYYTPPRPVTIYADKYSVCEGDEVTLSTSGAVFNGDYVWEEYSNNSWKELSGMNQSEIKLGVTVGKVFNNYVNKKYRVFTRNNGVKSLQSKEVQISVYPARPSNANIKAIDISCNGLKDGKIIIEGVTGNSSSYYYTLIGNNMILNSSKVSFPIVFPDDASNKGSLKGLPPGNYKMVIENYNNNSSSCGKEFPVIINEPFKLEIYRTSLSKPVTCYGENDGEMEVRIKGGIKPYGIMMDSGSYVDVLSSIVYRAQIGFGYHILYVKDKNNCIDTSKIFMDQPDSLYFDYSVVPIVCDKEKNGGFDISVHGGTNAYRYFLDDHEIYDTQIRNLGQGNYRFKVVDVHNCAYSDTIPLVDPPPTYIYLSDYKNISCFNGNDGFCKIQTTGGYGGFTYALNNYSFSDKGNFSNLPAGGYTAYSKDLMGCIDTMYFGLLQPDSFYISPKVKPVSCREQKDGEIGLKITGGTAPYHITWLGKSDTTLILSDLDAGSYHVIVEDNQNCLVENEINIIEPESSLQIEYSLDNALCSGVCNGKFIAAISGGYKPYKINEAAIIDPSHFELDSLCPGLLNITVIDSGMCKKNISVSVPASIEYESMLSDSILICEGQELTLINEFPNLSSEWLKNGIVEGVNNNLLIQSSGSYSYIAHDSSNCRLQKDFYVIQSTDAFQSYFILPTQGHVGDTLVVAEISWPVPDSIRWKIDGQILNPQYLDLNPYVVFDNEGLYTLQMTGYLGSCIDTISKNIYVFPKNLTQPDSSIISYNPFIVCSVFPNPNFGKFNVNVTMEQEAEIFLEMFDQYGKKIKEQEDLKNTFHKIEMDISAFKSGLYILNIYSASDQETFVIIVK